ncbi:MAG: hypothetical protein RR929_04040 [Erysipelotrichaceae bacterium]
MGMRKFLFRATIIGCIISLILSILYFFPYSYIKYDGIVNIRAKTTSETVQLCTDNNKCNDLFLKGVDLGAGMPGAFPNDFKISVEDYKRWFTQIAAMHANVIRVYIIQDPNFYQALYEFNKNKESPLYIIHGSWINEENMLSTMNAYDPMIKDVAEEDIKTLVDIIHGSKYVPYSKEHGHGRYSYDISKYVLGYIIGVEWDGNFVKKTNELNSSITSFDGEYLKMKKGTAFEAYLANLGNTAIAYETNRYEEQRLIAFSNWLPTDPFIQKYEPAKHNDLVQINTNNIKQSDKFLSGMFASYHIYPYYPNFLNYEPTLQSYKDTNGKKNSYAGYLNALKNQLDIPLVVSEFGLPSSYGIAHIDRSRGMNQGQLSENEHAERIATLYQDIVNTKLAGAIIFEWQDEWFKQSWNTLAFKNPDQNAFWHDALTNEQFYGLLAFDPGSKETYYPDGKYEEWKDSDIITTNEENTIYTSNDEAYVYFRIHNDNINFKESNTYIPIDITPKSGSRNSSQFDLKFDRFMDFIIEVKPNQSNFYVHTYYDDTYYTAEELPLLKPLDDILYRYTDNFNIKNQLMEWKSKFTVKGTKQEIEIPLEVKPIGKLKEGTANPNDKEYNSLVNYNIGIHDIEIRIPYLMLNIMDPPTSKIAGDFYYNQGAQLMDMDEMYISTIIKNDMKVISSNESKPYKLKTWKQPTYHERLKPAYYKMKEMFSKQ